jgi:hypothetical protein
MNAYHKLEWIAELTMVLLPGLMAIIAMFLV